MTGQTISLRRKLALQLCAASLLIPCSIWLVSPLLEGLHWTSVSDALHQISLLQWAGACLATLGSFAAVGRYDVIVHRHLGTRQPERDAQLSGASAVALSQFLGLGLVTGTIARWRALPDLTITQASAVTAVVTSSFLVTWLGLTGLAGLALPHTLPLPPYVFGACLGASLLLILYTAIRRFIGWHGVQIRLLSLRAIGALTVNAALDTGLAALALWILIPDIAALGFATILQIYLTGLGLGLISNTPGGVGPFEATLLWGLQSGDASAVVASLIAFRIVYFALPASLGAIYVMTRPVQSGGPLRQSVKIVRCNSQALHPEAQVARQGGALLMDNSGRPLAPIRRTTQCTVALFDPPSGFAALAPCLTAHAKRNATWPIAYKIGAANADAARHAGWAVLQIADDAVISPRVWTCDGKGRSGLRRKLRKAVKSGVCVKECTARSDDTIWAALERIDQSWRASRAVPRGFSMGQFCTAYLCSQRVYIARLNGEPIAFISFHDRGAAWALDLMRAAQDCPDGTMHLLVARAIETAKSQGVTTVSLAAIPCPPRGFPANLATRYFQPAQGLAQFKRSFDPEWTPIYAAAPNALILTIGLWDIWRDITRPMPPP